LNTAIADGVVLENEAIVTDGTVALPPADGELEFDDDPLLLQAAATSVRTLIPARARTNLTLLMTVHLPFAPFASHHRKAGPST
jgi:hypothetical protein